MEVSDKLIGNIIAAIKGDRGALSNLEAAKEQAARERTIVADENCTITPMEESNEE